MPKLYTTHCPRCEVLYKKLNLADIQVEIIEDITELVSRGFKSAPVLEVDGTFMDFKQAVDWIREVQPA